MKKSPAIFKWADFGPTKQRRAFESRKCRDRACGHPQVIISWLHHPYGDWAIIVAARRMTDEQEISFRGLAIANAVLDFNSNRFFWHRSKVNRLFK